MEPEKIQVEISQKVGILTMNNPPANALSPEFRQDLLSKLTEISKNDAVWTLIITGAGEKFFAAGADIPSLLKLDRKGGLERVRKAREFYGGVAYFEKPVIAAINGICLGLRHQGSCRACQVRSA
jgi:enoyl-CoA hydratase